MTLSVERWIGYDEAEALPEAPLGGFGGWFGRDAPHRWADYLARSGETIAPYAEALRAEVLRLGLKKGGDWHQEDAQGVPLFSDGTVALFSYRAWGDFMAAVWSEAENRDYQYMDFYMRGWGALRETADLLDQGSEG